jgi:Fe-S cluster assembly protein SufD
MASDPTVAVRSGPGSPPLRSAAQRLASFDVAAFPVPGGREEEWRFTPRLRMKRLFDDVASDAHLKWSTDLPAGAELVDLPADDPLLTQVPAPVDRTAALAHAHAGGATVVRVAAGVTLDRPATIGLHGTSTDDIVWGHLVIQVGANASATIVIDHTGSATYGAMLSVLVGDGASLTVVSLQDWDDDTVHVEQQAARVGRDASYTSAIVTLGGDLVRLTPTVQFSGPGATAELLGLYFADAGQHLEHRLFIDHDQPHCRSRVSYKGALQGDRARTVWVGDVLIRDLAVGTDTYEENRNLLLTEGARADSIPNLEIETGEVVGAGHASTTGRFDDEQLFYLMARGIPEAQARRLVVRGFFAEIVERIAVPEIRDRLIAAVERELGEDSLESPVMESVTEPAS